MMRRPLFGHLEKIDNIIVDLSIIVNIRQSRELTFKAACMVSASTEAEILAFN